MSNTGKVRMAIVGCGGIARGHHLPSFSKDPRVEWVVACDIVERRAQRACEEFGVPHAETDFREALDKYELDAVTVCTSNDAHAPVSIYAAQKGLHVMCEKPLALNLAEAEAMLEAVEKAGVVHMIDLSKRFPGHTRWVKAKLDAGEFGRIFSVVIDYYQGYRADPNCPIAWRLKKAKAGSGVLGDLGSHAMDLVRFWAGEPTRVMGYTKTLYDTRPAEDGSGMESVDCDDLAWVVGETDRGIPYSMRTTWNRVGTGDHLAAEIHTEKGTLLWRMHSPSSVQLLTSGGGWASGAAAEIEVPAGYDLNPFRMFIDHCISGEQAPESTFDDGAKVQHILEVVLRQQDMAGFPASTLK